MGLEAESSDLQPRSLDWCRCYCRTPWLSSRMIFRIECNRRLPYETQHEAESAYEQDAPPVNLHVKRVEMLDTQEEEKSYETEQEVDAHGGLRASAQSHSAASNVAPLAA